VSSSPSSKTVSLKDIASIKKKVEKDFSAKKLHDPAVLRTKYLGRKGLITDLLRSIGSVPLKKRAEFGKYVNLLRKEVEERLERFEETEKARKLGRSLTDLSFDVTAPFAPNTPDSEKPSLISDRGTLHPLTTVGEKAIRIFENMGFHTVEARRLDNDYNVFEALNIPQGHPARDMWDTFWTEDDLIPITHTSSMQNRILSSVKPPIREIIVGKCFRNEATDASHEHTFYQLEGVYVGEGITLADLIGTLSSFMDAFYGREVKYKIQPSYFPFVEPGLEFLIECMVCGQKGCPFCHYSTWVEVIPCGPIHPNVLREAGLKPETYTGFAWGVGFDRLVLLRNRISDIRHLHSGDISFLEQFA
jgi:phenylalanyl-tRNA synthetase alpha chain